MNAALSTPLWKRADLMRRGVDHHRLDTLLREGTLARLRPAVYVRSADVRSLTPEERIVLHARALALASADTPLFSHQTAAAIHGLPLYRPDTERVHVILDDRRRGAVARAVRHRGDVDPQEVETCGGLRVTGMIRTMADIARTCDFATAVCTLDGALRRVAVTASGTYDADAARKVTASALDASRRAAHGRARAARALAFADGRAQLPGESISRVRIAELGLHPPRLQVGVPAPSGGVYYIDFGLDDVRIWGEFDGRGKYTDPALRSGRSVEQVFLAEKQREDWIRGTTGRPVIRWGWSDLVDADALARRFAAFHVRMPPP